MSVEQYAPRSKWYLQWAVYIELPMKLALPDGCAEINEPHFHIYVLQPSHDLRNEPEYAFWDRLSVETVALKKKLYRIRSSYRTQYPVFTTVRYTLASREDCPPKPYPLSRFDNICRTSYYSGPKVIQSRNKTRVSIEYANYPVFVPYRVPEVEDSLTRTRTVPSHRKA